jgi:hypothetical protein
MDKALNEVAGEEDEMVEPDLDVDNDFEVFCL